MPPPPVPHPCLPYCPSPTLSLWFLLWSLKHQPQCPLSLCHKKVQKRIFKAEQRITRDMCFPGGGTRITRDMCFPGGGTHITRDMGFPGEGTHITKGMCFLGGGTRITRDMCFPSGWAHITRDMCFLVDKVFHKKRTYRSRLKEYLLFFLVLQHF